MQDDKDQEVSAPHAEDGNPLDSDSPQAWNRLIEAIGPASIMTLINLRMSESLKRFYSAEDVFQESLLHAWRDRASFDWQGTAAFRRWLLKIVDHRIYDLADREGAIKRGEGKAPLAFADLGGPGSESGAIQWAGPVASTTPSRALAASEQAEMMERAVLALPEDQQEVVRLRLLEDLSMPEVAAQLGIGVSAVAYRFRKGALEYQRLLGMEFETRQAERIDKSATGRDAGTS